MDNAYLLHHKRRLLHHDAQVAAVVWAALLPGSFRGQIPCTMDRTLDRGVAPDSLAIIHSAAPKHGCGKRWSTYTCGVTALCDECVR